jgi:ectoine hydroxylase-related dioxygenase (phytanoyl-CoA dioxygenase family)
MVTTPPHQDFLNNQGTPSLTAAWIPAGDCPMEQGTLAILRGSHRLGVLPLEFHMGPGNRQAVLPPEMVEQLTWVTNDISAGDVLLFGALTVHASLHNATPDMRLSVDFRYQREGEELTDLVLQPHFGRLTWDEIYAGWTSDEHQYYWKGLDYKVAPYDRSPFQASEPTKEEIAKVIRWEQARKKQMDRA